MSSPTKKPTDSAPSEDYTLRGVWGMLLIATVGSFALAASLYKGSEFLGWHPAAGGGFAAISAIAWFVGTIIVAVNSADGAQARLKASNDELRKDLAMVRAEVKNLTVDLAIAKRKSEYRS